jgi:putative ABC transport system ATP-binding protein
VFKDEPISDLASPVASEEAVPSHSRQPAQGEIGFVGLGHMNPSFQPAQKQDMPRPVIIGSDSAPHPSCAIALETRNLSRAVAGKVLVNEITVEVQQGEVLAVVGPSGAGKSSFLRLLNRLDEPTGGTVLANGRDYRQMAARELRRRVGMVMQMAYLFPGTVAANIAFGPLQHQEIISRGRIAALLERVGLPDYQDRDVSNLSGGEAQRVSLARALANSPETLLLDEPTSALDEVSGRAIEELVLGIIHERQMTCVIITHDMLQAARIADRAMVLEGGNMVAVGPTKEVLHAH